MSGEELLVCQDEAASYYDVHERICRLPADTPYQANELLEAVATGGMLGTGRSIGRLGVEIPRIRGEYEARAAALLEEVARRRGRMPVEELARWASAERTALARSIRWREGIGSVVLLGARDNWVYGLGGRTYPNLERRYLRRGVPRAELPERILRGATHPNAELTATAMRGARYLKYGGKAIFVISVATTGYRVLSASREELPQVLHEEAGGFFGGAIGAEVGIGLCLVFGIATGGWGLLACGVLGGMAGGIGGAYLGDRIYYSHSDEVVVQAQEEAIIEIEELEESMPLMCY
jgi:hypothetical protein